MATNVTWLPQVLRTSEQEQDEPSGTSNSGNRLLPDDALKPPPFPAAEEMECIAITPSNVEAWIEAQLLDCQNLARQHGLTKAAAILDAALDQLGQVTVSPSPATGH